MASSLDTLWSGDRDARLETADSTSWLAALEPSHAEYDAPTAEYVIESLRQFLRIEDDEWVANRFVDSLACLNDPPRSLMLEALLGRSVNVRWKALEWFMDHEDPGALEALESLWGRAATPWEKAALIEALARQGSSAYAEDLRALVEGKQGHEIAAAAMRALAEMEDSEAVTALLRVARDGPRFLRIEALAALESFPGSEPALRAVLSATRDADRKVASAAVEALAMFDAAAATERLIQVARDGSSSGLRATAVPRLASRPGAEVTETLVDLLRDADAGDDSVTFLAIQALMTRDDAEAVPALLGAGPRSGQWSRAIGLLVKHLSRDREHEPGTRTITSSCSFSDWDPDDPEVLRASPPRGIETIRCWESPGAAGDPEDFPRLDRTMLLRVTDYFDDHGDVWVETESLHSEDCWVPLRLLERPETDIDADAIVDPDVLREKSDATGGVVHAEFDLRVEELAAGAATTLLEAGVLTVIEPGSDVVGVALTVEPGNRDQATLIGSLKGSRSSILGGQIDMAADTLASYYRDDPELGRLLGWTPGDEEEAP